jgi:hypothetical protein
MEDVIEVLAIDILPPFSKRCHSHVEKIRTCALRKMADSNSVDLLVVFNSGLKRDYGSSEIIAIITWWEVQLPLCAVKDLFAFQMQDPGGGHLHPWKLTERLFNLLWITATSGRLELQFLL